jgi:hypothetical protein
MKLSSKVLFIITLLFAAANIFIFLNRNNGFEYIKYSGIRDLYPASPDNSFLNKWNNHNKKFSKEELNEGLLLLNQFIKIDSITTDKKKVISIAAWLFKSFDKQLGTPADSLSRLAPLFQYRSLIAHKEKQLWCGQFQAMFGFFCTAAGLKNRYVEIVPVRAGHHAGIHEINEVWVNEIKQWVMADVTRNFLLINKDSQSLSAAEYLDYRCQNQLQSFLITRFDTALNAVQSVRIESSSVDNYFNNNYALRYYLNKSLSEVYTPAQKAKRYFLADPWYEMYSPGSGHSNFLFRVKQFFVFGFLVFLLLLLLRTIKYRKQKN